VLRLALVFVLVMAGTAEALPRDASCRVPGGHDPDVIRAVHAVGLSLGVSDKVMLAGFEAGWVESHMNNLACGDADSLGVFQQRPSMGWGSLTPSNLWPNRSYARASWSGSSKAGRHHTRDGTCIIPGVGRSPPPCAL